MTYMQRGNKFKQISVHLIVYSIYVFLGSTALFFSHRLWNTTVGNLIIFMSPYIIITCHILLLSFLGKQTSGYTGMLRACPRPNGFIRAGEDLLGGA